MVLLNKIKLTKILVIPKVNLSKTIESKVDKPMINTLRLLLLALTTTILIPASASAITFFPRSLDPGDTFLTSSDPNDLIEDGIFAVNLDGAVDELRSFEFDFTILNDLATGQTVSFEILHQLGLENLSFSVAGFVSDVVDAATFTLAAGESTTLTLAFDIPANVDGRGFVTTIAAVPLPAGVLLLLTALGGLFVSRRRTPNMTAA